VVNDHHLLKGTIMLNNIKNIVLIASGIAFISSCVIIMKSASDAFSAMTPDDSVSFDEHVSEALHIVK
jgi:hypothetical protein